jgi:hypothetical protein
MIDYKIVISDHSIRYWIIVSKLDYQIKIVRQA